MERILPHLNKMKGIKLLGGIKLKTLLAKGRISNNVLIQNKVNYSTDDKYNTKDIKLHSVCNLNTIKKNLYNFLKRNKFNLNYLYIRLLVKIDDGRYLSLGNGHVIELGNKKDLKMYYEHLAIKLAFMFDEYQVKNIVEIRIIYGDSNKTNYETFAAKNRSLTSIDGFKKAKNDLNLPKNNQYYSWGTLVIISPTVSYLKDLTINELISNIVIEKLGDKCKLRVETLDGKIYNCEDVHKENKLKKRNLISIIDMSNLVGDNTLPVTKDKTSEIKSTPVFGSDLTNISLSENKRNIKLSPKSKKTVIKHMTLDLETALTDNVDGTKVMKIICASLFWFGRDPKLYFDYAHSLVLNKVVDKIHSYTVHLDNKLPYRKGKVKLIKELFDIIFEHGNIKEPMWKDRDGQLKYYLGAKVTRKTVLYIHNGARFDLVLLLKDLLNTGMYKIHPLYKDGKFISLKVVRKSDNAEILIKDSFLILNSSLDKLAKSFNLVFSKTIFPYTFPTLDNLDYIGDVPDIKYFSDKVTLDQYNEYKSRFNGNWNLREELEKYCENDCRVLYYILDKFNELILNKFNIDIHKFPTLSSLAYNIFKANYLKYSHKQLTQNAKGKTTFVKVSQIPVIAEENYKIIKQAYFGGHCDMYIPTNPIGTNIYCYDVNSLYPYVMKAFDYPINFLTNFIGDIRILNPQLWNDTLGFYKVRVNCPNSLIHPILPIKIKGNTVFPTGTWEGLYFSEEIKNAENFGYKFEILEGIVFTKANIFSDYITKLYDIKSNTSKDDPMYGISKLLLNSLYGRFGLNPDLNNYYFYHKNLMPKNKAIDIELTLDDYYLVCDINSKNVMEGSESNVAIAGAVTAYARIHMSQFKNSNLFNLYYSDTDSIYIDKELDSKYVSDNELGLLKLEKVLSKFVAVGPKFYGGVELNTANQFSKVKGLSNSLTIEQLEYLLVKDNIISLKQNKWFRDYVDSSVIIRETSYDSKATDNKRRIIFDSNNIMVNTKPIVLT